MNNSYEEHEEESEESEEENNIIHSVVKAKHEDNDIYWQEEINDDSASDKDNSFLRGMARDNTRGPYGMDANYADENLNKAKGIASTM